MENRQTMICRGIGILIFGVLSLISFIGVILVVELVPVNKSVLYDDAQCNVYNCSSNGDQLNITLVLSINASISTFIQLDMQASTLPYLGCDGSNVGQNVTLCYYVYTDPPSLALTKPQSNNTLEIALTVFLCFLFIIFAIFAICFVCYPR